MEDEFAVILIGTFVMTFVVVSMFLFAFLYQRKIGKKKNEVREIEQLLKSTELKSAYALIEGQDSERERIANDLHDRMGGQLSTIKIYLELLADSTSVEEKEEHLKKLFVLADESIKEVRIIAHDLENSFLSKEGLPKAIDQLCSAINATKKIKINQHVSLHKELAGALMRDVYQIIQELVTNTLRHGQASEVRLELTSFKDEVNLIFEDNGIGFDFNEIEQGIGLKSIRMRSDRYNGTLTIDSVKGRGSTFIIEIPL